MPGITNFKAFRPCLGVFHNETGQCINMHRAVIERWDVTKLLATGIDKDTPASNINLFQRFQAIGGKTRAYHINALYTSLAPVMQNLLHIRAQPFSWPKAGLKGNVVTIEPTGFEQMAFWITALAPLLLLGGILGAYLEFKVPGATWPGIISAICFALFFLGHYLAGLAGWEVVALFVLGMVLVLIEILFFAHSTIVIGVLGVFLMLGSLLWTMIDRYPGQNFFPTGKMLAVPLLNMLIAIVGSFIVIALLARYLPRTSIYRRFALMDSNPPGPSLVGVPRQFATALALTPGTPGTAVTVLRPSGKARFADHVVDVVTEGEFIAPQTPITVTQTDGMRVVVKSAAPA